MEQFFSPTREFHDLWEASRHYSTHAPFEHDEVELAVPVEEFLIYRWDWEDLSKFAYGDALDKILWITEDMFLVGGNMFKYIPDDIDFVCLLDANFIEIDGVEQRLTLYNRKDSAVSIGARSVFWRAIETSKSVLLGIDSMMTQGASLPSGPILSQLLRGSPSLQGVDFDGFHFEEEHCRTLATMQRTDLKVGFNNCTLKPRGVEGAFIEWFRHGQVLTELVDCWMGSRILSALSGNNSVKMLSFNMIDQCSEEHIHTLTQALPTNQGIERLMFSEFGMSYETCRLLFCSLSTHPRIRHLSIRNADRSVFTYSAEVKSTMLNAILQMLHLNTVVHTIEVPDCFNNDEVYRNSILPRLEMNRSCFEVQRQAVKRADPSIRPQLLGRALHVVRYNPELVFLFLSENVPAFVRTEGEEEEDSTTSLENDPDLVSGQKRKASS
jgi:hypothetical protein